MKITKLPQRLFEGTMSGTLREGDGIAVRMSAEITLDRDIDGSWIAYVSTGPSDEEFSATLTARDPQACEVLDALFELIANPVAFEGREIGERRGAAPDAA